MDPKKLQKIDQSYTALSQVRQDWRNLGKRLSHAYNQTRQCEKKLQIDGLCDEYAAMDKKLYDAYKTISRSKKTAVKALDTVRFQGGITTQKFAEISASFESAIQAIQKTHDQLMNTQSRIRDIDVTL